LRNFDYRIAVSFLDLSFERTGPGWSRVGATGQELALGSGRLDVMMLAFIEDHVANQFGWLTVPFAR